MLIIDRDKTIRMAIVLYVVYLMFGELLFNGLFTDTIMELAYLLLLVGLFLFSNCNHMTVEIQKNYMLIYALLLFFVLFRNQNGLFSPILFKWLLYLIGFVCIYKKRESFGFLYKTVGYCGLIHVAATFFFFYFPEVYRIMVDLWGYFPTGTLNQLSYGYHAGLANHYSLNGIFTAVPCIVFGTLGLPSTKSQGIQGRIKNHRCYYLFLSVLSFTALIMTTKRAHLLFCFLALAGTCSLYCVYGKKSILKFCTGSIGILVVLFCLYRISPHISVLHDVVKRLSSIGNGDGSMRDRLRMWELAWDLFKKNPVMGVGWGGYRYAYERRLFHELDPYGRYPRLSAHNVYFQLLAETGVLGFIFYVVLTGSILIKSVRLMKQIAKNSDLSILYHQMICFSFAIQVFYMLYSFTGNCLYDITFGYYCIAVAVMMGIRLEIIQRNRVYCDGINNS